MSAGNPSLEVSVEHAALFEWIVRGTTSDDLPRIVDGFVAAPAADVGLDGRRSGRRRSRADATDASAALALVTAATESRYEMVDLGG